MIQSDSWDIMKNGDCHILFSLKVGFKGFNISKEKQETRVPFLHCGQKYELAHGSVVIAAVISCTNNCNPSVMLTAGKGQSQKRTRIRFLLKMFQYQLMVKLC